MKGYLTLDFLLSLFLLLSIILYLMYSHIVSFPSVKNLIEENKNQTIKFYEKINDFYSKFSSRLNEYTVTAYVSKSIALKWYQLCITYFEVGLRCKSTSLSTCPIKPMLNISGYDLDKIKEACYKLYVNSTYDEQLLIVSRRALQEFKTNLTSSNVSKIEEIKYYYREDLPGEDPLPKDIYGRYFYEKDFDDSSWSTLYGNSLTDNCNGKSDDIYLRIKVNIPGEPQFMKIKIESIEDGAKIWINGHEVYNSFPSDQVNNLELTIPKTYLVPGKNIISLWVADGDESGLPPCLWIINLEVEYSYTTINIS